MGEGLNKMFGHCSAGPHLVSYGLQATDELHFLVVNLLAIGNTSHSGRSREEVVERAGRVVSLNATGNKGRRGG